MWLYPLPVILSVWIWLFVFYSTGRFALLGLALTLAGVVVFYLTRNVWAARSAAGQEGNGISL